MPYGTAGYRDAFSVLRTEWDGCSKNPAEPPHSPFPAAAALHCTDRHFPLSPSDLHGRYPFYPHPSESWHAEMHVPPGRLQSETYYGFLSHAAVLPAGADHHRKQITALVPVKSVPQVPHD